MMRSTLWALTLCFSLQASAFGGGGSKKFESAVVRADNWDSFEAVMLEAQKEDRKIGWSYIASGTLVTLGGVYGAQNSDESSSKLIFGLSQGFGIAAIGYGVTKLWYGNPYTSFYQTLQNVPLTKSQRDSLVRAYMDEERQKRELIRKVNIATHTAIGLLNIYSASQEPEGDARKFLYFLSGVNFAFAFAYTF